LLYFNPEIIEILLVEILCLVYCVVHYGYSFLTERFEVGVEGKGEGMRG
jgi:hypothetical protein